MYYPFYIFVLQGPGSGNEFIFYARGLDQSGRTRGSSSGWLLHLVLELHHRPTGRIFRLLHSITDQLVGLLGAHFCSALTSSPTSWLDCSVLTFAWRSFHRLPVRWIAQCSFHRRPAGRTARRLGFIASYTGGLPAMLRTSSVFRFFVQESSAKLETTLAVGFCYVSSVG